VAFSIKHLRRWIAATATLFLVVVGGVYFYARHRVQNALKEVPQKIGLDIQQTAQGFTVSKSEQGHTIFKVQASKAVQFKQGGRTQLHEVEITIYGRDASRFDRISGHDFDYDPQTGNVTAQGEVHIELEANPEGGSQQDQAAPAEARNPISLTTSGLVFNQKTGDAFTHQKVIFQTPQASGQAMGIRYSAKDNVLWLESQVDLAMTGPHPVHLQAARGNITKDPREIHLENAHMDNGSQKASAQEATAILNDDNVVQKILARGDVHFEAASEDGMDLRAAQLEMILRGEKGELASALFSGGVQFQRNGTDAVSGSAGRVQLDFGSKNKPRLAHAEDNVILAQHPANPARDAQDMQLTAGGVKVFLGNQTHPERAVTEGAAQIAIAPTQGASQKTIVTADTFEARFDARGQINSVHGAPNARIVNSTPGQPDRVSTSNALDAVFHPGKGLQAIVQQGDVHFTDGSRQASAQHARYTASDQMLELTGSPRVSDTGMSVTARMVKMNRATGDAYAEGDVKSSYTDLKTDPNGALLASSSPIHVTARSMKANRTPSVALYEGGVRLWQDANAVEAPSIEFDRDRRSVVAHGTDQVRVTTILVETEKDGTSVPVTIRSGDLTYTDAQRRIHFADGVRANSQNVEVSSYQMDAFLKQSQNTPKSQPSELDRIVAAGKVEITEPNRRAEGDQLVYTAAEDKFVLTGGPPSIFDAERGKVTGVSLTFYKHDDTVEVEGTKSSPTVTQTRVAQ
jgi:lipopolysaccharide export system protein LptA